jgi:hypothetical protein
LIELHALAFEQKEEGKTDLAEFLVSRTPRVVADLMQSTWEVEEAKAKLERAKKTRMERNCCMSQDGVNVHKVVMAIG